MDREAYPHQVDCYWAGHDRNSHVAVFVTAGEGPVPSRLLIDGLIDWIGEQIDNLPETTTVAAAVHFPNPDAFADLARKGLFVYDWQDAHRSGPDASGCYELVAAPTSPIQLTSLPFELGNTVRQCGFLELSFPGSPVIDATACFHCVDSASTRAPGR